MADLKRQVLHEVRDTITENTWLGAYRTTRVWEDMIWEEHNLGEVEEEQISASEGVEEEDEDDGDEEEVGDIIVGIPN